MKIFIVLINLLLFVSAPAPKLQKLVYEYTDTNDYTCDAFLFLKGKESLFILNDKRTELNNTMPNGNIYKLYNDKWSRIFYKNEQTNITRIPIYGKELVYKSDKLTEQVKLTGKSKTIGKYKCQEATIKKGGKSYAVWFTTDVPISAGPLNLAEVPGLIVQVKDLNATAFNIILKSIVNESSETLFDSYKEYISAKKVMDHPTYERETIKLISNVKRENFAILAKFGAALEMSEDQRYYTVHLVDIPKQLVPALQKITQ